MRSASPSVMWNSPVLARSCCWQAIPPPTGDRVATLLVGALAPVITAIEAAGGQVIDGPAPGRTGNRLIARHHDGAVFEYIETITP